MYKAFYTTKGAAGTGLGLWITSDIIKRHHGYLKVRSRTTQGRNGTVFQVFLPYKAAEAGEYVDLAG
jgi:signal transduction histidine kinase